MTRKPPRQFGLFQRFVPEPKDPRGRKRIAWSSQTAETVTFLRSLRKTQAFIAQAVGLSEPTLKRIYSVELEGADDQVRTAIDLAVIRRACDGHTPSARLALELLDKQAARELSRPTGEPASGATSGEPAIALEPAARLGKKEARALAAGEMRGLFAPLPAPTKTAH